MEVSTIQALPRVEFSLPLTLLVIASAVTGGVLAYPFALLLSHGDRTRREALTAWVIACVGFVMLAYVNALLVLMWIVRYL